MTKHITDTTRLTVLKHLAKGKTPEVVAVAMKLDRFEVVDIGSHHGYPDTDKLNKAVEIITQKLERQALDELPPAQITAAPAPRRMPTPRSRQTAGAESDAPAAAQPAPVSPAEDETAHDQHLVTRPDEIRAVLNAGKQSSSTRAQKLTDRILADVERLKQLLNQEQEKAEKARRAAAARAALERKKAQLQKELAAVNAQLRGGRSPRKAAAPSSGATGQPSAKDIRSWADSAGVECPSTGRIPNRVRAAYDQAHPTAA
ncbi:histone-like nucleoid-structuring protein Lsr2 [Nocardioides sp.]|uniref:Lsr2 family DNA-binding protein n=1 Tax=Nocardioides sp. TaxID=35761 RepID=UPI002736F038|nr:histone-like nucleoid-structuring protein Lsr2 [Nocardioides sp.]MDP3889843.1 hypothetical protein [Nocardioides sp.]